MSLYAADMELSRLHTECVAAQARNDAAAENARKYNKWLCEHVVNRLPGSGTAMLDTILGKAREAGEAWGITLRALLACQDRYESRRKLLQAQALP